MYLHSAKIKQDVKCLPLSVSLPIHPNLSLTAHNHHSRCMYVCVHVFLQFHKQKRHIFIFFSLDTQNVAYYTCCFIL